MISKPQHDVIVLGAGAAGLFFAGEAARLGARVIALDHAERLGEKIRISGGGRCNFTNLGTAPHHFLSQNPKFCISALRQFSAQDFLKRIESAGVAWEEKALGQLFCRDKAQAMIDFLMNACRRGGVDIRTGTNVETVRRSGDVFEVATDNGIYTAPRLVVATGGKSIPKIGATGLGYQLAEQFGLSVVEPRPALVPLTFEGAIKDFASALSGVGLEASVAADPETQFGKRKPKKKAAFRDGFLFTHRGLSGPSILQVSSYWREGGDVVIDLYPAGSAFEALKVARATNGRQHIGTAISGFLPKRVATSLASEQGWEGNIADWSDKKLSAVGETINNWRVTPAGSEGYRTAEVTLGGVSTDDLNSRTMEAAKVPGLFFIGEVVDVTGWLGGYNFQWAWSSGYTAANAIAAGLSN